MPEVRRLDDKGTVSGIMTGAGLRYPCGRGVPAMRSPQVLRRRTGSDSRGKMRSAGRSWSCQERADASADIVER